MYGITIRSSTSEHFPIKGCSLHFYDRVIKCHDIRDEMSAIPSMSWHSNNNMPGSVFKFYADVSIDTELFTYEIRTYDIKHFFQHTPKCARSACIGGPLIDFPLIDFSQHSWLVAITPRQKKLSHYNIQWIIASWAKFFLLDFTFKWSLEVKHGAPPDNLSFIFHFSTVCLVLIVWPVLMSYAL